MSTSFHPNASRVIALDLDHYTDGDPEMRRELICLMIDNIRELQEAVLLVIAHNDVDTFKKVSHKVKPTISMLNDKQLTDAIEEIKGNKDTDSRQETISSFETLCNDIISILEKE